MSQIQKLLGEFAHEAKTTRRLMERLPSDKLDWKPHEKSSSLGKLAKHIAGMPGGLGDAILRDDFELGGKPTPDATSTEELLTTFDANVVKVKDILGGMTDDQLDERWTAKKDGKQIMEMTRGQMIRAMLLNHWYHHRGQLSVYLRLLDVPVPSIYGPSADENPFG